MRLVRLEAHDFMQFAELDLDLASLHEQGFAQAVIVGPNGSGKSALLDAIVWCLFGRATDRAESTDGLIRFDRLGMWVRTTWDRDGQTVVIRRDRSIETKAGESMLALSVDGQSRKQHTIGETQIEIERLTGLDREQLLAGPLMEQGESNRLMRLAPAPRKELFSALCGLDRFVPWHERAKAWRTSADAEVAAIVARIVPLRVRMDRELDVERTLSEATGRETAAQSELERLSREMTELSEEAQVLREQALRSEQLSERLTALNAEDETIKRDEVPRFRRRTELALIADAEISEPSDQMVVPDLVPAGRLGEFEGNALRVPAAHRLVSDLEAQIAHAEAAHAKAESEGLCDRCPYRGDTDVLDETRRAFTQGRIDDGKAWLAEHENDGAGAAAIRSEMGSRQREIDMITDANDQRRAAYAAAVARQVAAKADLVDELTAFERTILRQRDLATESQAVQAERLRLIQTQDRAREVVEELADRTVRYESFRRMWADANGDRRVAEAALEDVRAAQAEMRQVNLEYIEATKARDDLTLVEGMFHRDGLPTMLLELTIPLVEARANELLLRMPGELYVELVTQKATKKGTFSETLDVAVTKRGRPLAYGMASGAERFRIDLALRLGLAGVLLHRTGAQFGTLFLDEPFAAQDPSALEALLESVAAVVDEFGVTLLVTHQPEVADRFPAKILVSESARQTASVRIAA